MRGVRNRGQWFLGIGATDDDAWPDLDLWRSCLENREPPLPPSTGSEQAAYLTGALPRIEDALGRDRTIAACLQGEGERRTRRMLG